MTDMTLTAAPTRLTPARRDLTRPFRDEPVFAGAALVLAVFALPVLLALGLDGRTYLDEPIWIKPLKFLAALPVYLMTLAIYARFLPPGMTARRSYRVYAWAVVGAIFAEALWVSLSAANGIGSHFNLTTPMMATLYAIMGPLAILLTSASAVYGVAIWRNRATGLSAGMHSALALGLILTLPLTLLVAGTMAQSGGHHVGEAVTGASLPVMGWSREVGDLRVSHFFATHALHLVPLAMLVLPATRAMAWGAAGLVCAVVIATFLQALAGQPLWPV